MLVGEVLVQVKVDLSPLRSGLREARAIADVGGEDIAQALISGIASGLVRAGEEMASKITENAQSALSLVRAALEEASASMAEAGEEAGEAAAEGIEEGLKDAEDAAKEEGRKVGESLKDTLIPAVRRLGDAIKNILSAAMSVTIGIGAFAALRNIIRDLTDTFIGFNSTLQQARMSFGVLVEAGTDAQAFLRQLIDIAVATGLELPQVLIGARRLIAMGFAAKQAAPMMLAISAAAAGLSLGSEGIMRIALALGQIRAKGKLVQAEARQLAEAGIRVWDILAEGAGKSAEEIMELSHAGKLFAKDVIPLLLEGMRKQFGRILKEFPKTWEGATTAIRTLWSLTVHELTGGLFNMLTVWAVKLRDALVTFYYTFRELRAAGLSTMSAIAGAIAKAFGPDVAAAAVTLIGLISGIVRVIAIGLANVATAIRRHWILVRNAIVAALVAFFVFKVVPPIINAVSAAVRALAAAMVAVDIAVTKLTAKTIVLALIMLILVPILVYLIITITDAVADYASMIGGAAGTTEQFSGTIGDLESLLGGIGEITGELGEGLGEMEEGIEGAGRAAAKNIQSFDEVHQIVEDTASAAGGISIPPFPPIEIPPIRPEDIISEDFGPGITARLDKAAREIPSIFDFVWGRVKAGAGNLWADIKKGLGELVVSFFKVGLTIVLIFAGVFLAIVTIVTLIVAAIAVIIVGLARSIPQILSATFGTVGKIISAVVKEAVDAAKILFSALVEYARIRISQFATFISTLWDIVTGKISIDEGVQRLTKSTQEAEAQIQKLTADTMIALAATAKEAADTIKPAIEDFGEKAIVGTWNNIKNTAEEVWPSIRDTIGGAWNDLGTSAKKIWSGEILGDFTGAHDNMESTAQEKWTSIDDIISGNWYDISETSKDVWPGTQQTVTDATEGSTGVLRAAWPVAQRDTIATWSNIENKSGSIWGGISTTISNIVNGIGSFLGETWGNIQTTLGSIWDSIRAAGVGAWEGLRDAIKNVINAIIRFINKLIEAWNSFSITLPPIHIETPLGTIHWEGFTLGTPDIPLIPELARGGIITKPTVVLAGERGPEAIIPLSETGSLADQIASAIARALGVASPVGEIGGGPLPPSREIVLEIDGRRIGRAMLPLVLGEAERRGMKLDWKPLR